MQIRVVNLVFGPPLRAVRIAVVALDAVGQQQAACFTAERPIGVVVVKRINTDGQIAVGTRIEKRSGQRLEAPIDNIVYQPVVRVSHAVQVDVVAEDQVIFFLAIDRIVAGAADNHIAPEVAKDDIVVTVLQFERINRQDRIQLRRLDFLLERIRQVRIGNVLNNLAVITEDDVAVIVLRPDGNTSGIPIDQVATGSEIVANW